jgi:type I restriction enzyme S subunit
LNYVFSRFYSDNINYCSIKQNTGIQNLDSSSYLAEKFGFPPEIEQQKIASFLDHETAKIDTLIEKQQQLIKLLKEKRKAVISHAVTKGLNPNAPMRDSGVEWLGEVPEGWEVLRLNLLFRESSLRASSEEELKYPVLSISIHHGMSDKELTEEELDRKVQRSEDRSLYKTVKSNFLAYNMMRAWQGGFGASKLLGLVSPAYIVCEPKTSLNSYYFEMVLRTQNAVVELKRFSRGITDFRLRLYWDEFKNINVPVPPANEVESILKAISDIDVVYDNLITVGNKQIKLLQERRTALISAAVTGKIDVRDWEPPCA